jgi:uncharacterized membrane protein YeaQ/YmgE (transglycosylase-associated protein family)
MQLIVFISIGLSAGALAGLVARGHGHAYGVVGDIVVGVTGAFLGGWMSTALLGFGGFGFLMNFLMAFIGAVIPLWAIRRVAPGHA